MQSGFHSPSAGWPDSTRGWWRARIGAALQRTWPWGLAQVLFNRCRDPSGCRRHAESSSRRGPRSSHGGCGRGPGASNGGNLASWHHANPGRSARTLSMLTLRFGQSLGPGASLAHGHAGMKEEIESGYRCSLGRTAKRCRSWCQSRRSSSVTGGPRCGPAPGGVHAASQTSRVGSDKIRPQARQPTESWFRKIEPEPHRGQTIATTPSETSMRPHLRPADSGFGVGCSAGWPHKRRRSLSQPFHFESSLLAT